MQAVSESSSSFKNRIDLCTKYKGLRNEDLNKVAGVTDAVFVHAAGFIGAT